MGEANLDAIHEPIASTLQDAKIVMKGRVCDDLVDEGQ